MSIKKDEPPRVLAVFENPKTCDTSVWGTPKPDLELIPTISKKLSRFVTALWFMRFY